MAKTFKIIAAVPTILAFLLLANCGEKESLIKNGPAGPNTSELIDPLPEGLVPDKQNSRHTANDLNPNIN